MGRNIFNRFYDSDLIDKPTWEKLLKKLEVPSCEIAALAQMEWRSKYDIEGLLIQSIGPHWTREKIMSAHFKSISARVLPHETRMEIDDFLEPLSPKAFRAVLGKPKSVHMITELYYGQLKLFIGKKHETEFQNSLQKKNLNLTLTSRGSFINEYEFNNTTVPFAYRMEALKKFNG